jgi:hypothetical protein
MDLHVYYWICQEELVPGLQEATQPISVTKYISKACLSEEFQTQNFQVPSQNVDSYFGDSNA